MKMPLLATVTACAALAGCGNISFGSGPPATPGVRAQVPDEQTLRPLARPGQAATSLGQAGRSADALDTTTPRERAQAQSPANGDGARLGETLASLGRPTEQGFWLRTGLVTRVTQGRVERADGAGAVRVELRPSGNAPGAGSQLSLAAFRALQAPLTELLPLQVFAE
ncbi:MAG: D-galactarate dehydratase [Alphaproteobacteria bacterium]|jgi:hypothetical protein|nr:D-galactarate dehydratase [Alphaproteobacteria bacterium]